MHRSIGKFFFVLFLSFGSSACTALDRNTPEDPLNLDASLDGSDSVDGSVPGDGDGDGDMSGDGDGDGDGDGNGQCAAAVFDESLFDQACFE